MSHLPVPHIPLDYINNPMDTRKISKAVQKMIPHVCQRFLPVGRLGKQTGNGHSAYHRTENDEEIPLPLCC
jgi:hypothetical protein